MQRVIGRVIVVAMGWAALTWGSGALASPADRAARCWVEPQPVVAGTTHGIWAEGLPTRTALNVFVTDADGTEGVPVGAHSDGLIEDLHWRFSAAGPTLIQVTGPTKKNWSTTRVYAECSYSVLAA